MEDFTHPTTITAGQVFIYGYEMDTFTGQRIQKEGQGSYQGFTLTGTHLDHIATVQQQTTHYLHVVMPQSGSAH